MANTPDTRIVRLSEQESSSPIAVTRRILTGHNRYQKPETSRVATRVFFSLRDALVWMTEGQGFMHHVEVPLREHISASLDGDPMSRDEWVTVTMNGTTGRSPRTVEGHHAVSTDRENFFTLIIDNVGPETMFDRGVAWVEVTDPNSPTFSFALLPTYNHRPDEWVEAIDSMCVRVDQVLHDLTRGMVDVPSSF